MNCPWCGAPVQDVNLRCSHCGGAIPRPGPGEQELKGVTGTPAEAEEMEKLLRYSPSAVGPGVRLVMMVFFGVLFAGLTVFCFVVKPKGGPPPLFFKIFISVVGLGGVAMIMGGIRGLTKLSTSPLHRLPAVVVGKREKTSTSKYSDPVIYFLTIKTDDGLTKEHKVGENIYNEVDMGDTGVAYLKGGYLLDFKPVRLPGSAADRQPPREA